ncbi:hypothetical protein FA95DRAFT_1612005 [Auriscalpium vulgare]|uniref:Uncharacterized protein n=1 Tax=Auriscalpium vulgare TaxID=40419 RepID=A0ACB8R7T4_9AGAM|nr:hypothetical protein FA95DRAFT_1612005 [Auriscalpium vulgare]
MSSATAQNQSSHNDDKDGHGDDRDSNGTGGSNGNSGSGSSSSSSSSNGSGNSGGNSNGNAISSNASNNGNAAKATKLNTPPSKPPCFYPCVSNSDPKLLYSPGWTLVPPSFFTSAMTPTDVLHRTSLSGSNVTFTFNATAIVVFGIVPKNNGTTAVASYTVDGQIPSTPVVPNSEQELLQPLFTSGGLLPGQSHNLTITVTDGSNAPYTLSHFLLDGPLSMQKMNPPHAVGPARDTIIVAAALGSFIVLLLAGMLLSWFLRRRRARAGLAQPWRRNFQQGSSSGPTLTSSASIVRGYSVRESSFYPYVPRSRDTAITFDLPSASPPARVPSLPPPPLSEPKASYLKYVPPEDSLSGKNWF